MGGPGSGRKPLDLKMVKCRLNELASHHANQIDPDDAEHRRRFHRVLDRLYTLAVDDKSNPGVARAAAENT